MMDEQEKAKLTKQKKLVDTIEYVNTALEAFDRLEEYQGKNDTNKIIIKKTKYVPLHFMA